MLRLTQITHAFPGGFRPVLQHMNLQLQSGDFCVVIGSNGSGKSTLMKVISGEYTPNQGRILLNGTDVTHKQRRRGMTSVIQDVNKGTIPEMTLLENMILSLSRVKPRGFSLYHRRASRIGDMLKTLDMGLEKYVHAPLSHLSGGQRQMVATLMAMATRPQLLLLDEHTSALDPCMQKTLMTYTNQAIAAQKLTCLMITHKLDDAIQYGNRLIMLHQGEIVLDLSKKAKQSVRASELLALFHHYEDLDLLGAPS
jgi:putative ABC transport system ATP-binding protein